MGRVAQAGGFLAQDRFYGFNEDVAGVIMLQDMRDKAQSWVAKAIVAFIAFTFAIFGLESLRPDSSNPEVASVNGEKITQRQLMDAVEQQRRLIYQQAGKNFDPSMLDENLLQRSSLESLVQKALLNQQISKNDMVVSDQLIDQMLRTAPEFQVDGQYNSERLMQYIRSLGMTITQFRHIVREQMVTTQLQAGIAATEFTTLYELNDLMALQSQSRDVSWMVLSAEKAREAAIVTDGDIQAFYEAEASRFMQPEQVSVRYIVLDKASLREGIEIDEDDIRLRYESDVTDIRRTAAEQLSASMILLEPSDKRDEAATLAEAKKLREQLQGGADFAALAKEYSDDPDSSAKGGSLGTVEKGFFGDDFDSALASLSAGEISEPVVAEFGVVLIRRDGAAEVRIPTLEQMRPTIVKELRDQAVDPIFVEKSQKLADISFEAADLVQPAETLGLTIQETPLFTRNGGVDISSNSRVVTAAFSDDVINLGANSDLVELDQDRVLVLHVKEHKKPEQRALADVRADIEAALRAKQGEEQLQKRTDTMIAELNGGADRTKLASANDLKWQEQKKAQRFSREIPAQLLQAAFKLPHPAEGKASFGSARLPNDDFAVVMVGQVTSGTEKLAGEQARMMSSTLSMRAGGSLYQEYLKNLHEQAEVVFPTRNEG